MVFTKSSVCILLVLIYCFIGVPCVSFLGLFSSSWFVLSNFHVIVFLYFSLFCYNLKNIRKQINGNLTTMVKVHN